MPLALRAKAPTASAGTFIRSCRCLVFLRQAIKHRIGIHSWATGGTCGYGRTQFLQFQGLNLLMVLQQAQTGPDHFACIVKAPRVELLFYKRLEMGTKGDTGGHGYLRK